MDVLNNVTAPDSAPTTASTIDGTVPHRRVVVDVANAAIYWQAKTGGGRATADWQPQQGAFMAPGSRRLPIDGNIYGFRFWAAVKAADIVAPGLQAQVTAHVE